MSTTITPSLSPALQDAIDAACAKIAPAWPLDRMIAVNPYWGWTDRPATRAAADIGALAAAPFLMPRAWYQRKHAEGAIPVDAMRRAIARGQVPTTVDAVLASLETTPDPLPRHPLVTDLRDEFRDALREATWQEHVTQQVGQTCAAYFDQRQALWQPARADGLYAFWLSLARADIAPQLLLGDAAVRRAITELPSDIDALFTEAIDTLALPRTAQEQYLTALLLRVAGWAAHASFRRWDARLHGTDDGTLRELLALRLAWELVLYRTAAGTDLPLRWTRARREWQERAAAVAPTQATDWVLQRAFELQYQDRLAKALVWHPSLQRAHGGASAPATRSAQAVFCIDVRSEVLRRHLERIAPDVATLGFAGFFGIPLAYDAIGGERRPQLPGLLAASVIATDDDADAASAKSAQARRDEAQAQWRTARSAAPATFATVETTGLAAVWQMLSASFDPPRRAGDPLRVGRDLPESQIAPTLASTTDGTPLTLERRVAMAEGILRGMSLVESFAPVVLLVGHGAVVTNNPQAAGLACGACGGQSGEVNARVAAGLLNDAEVRSGLASRGITIPLATRFVAALHDTVTDDVLFFPDPQTRGTHAEELAALQSAFSRAARHARVERASRLGGMPDDPRELADAMRARAADWSEVRPEWALARNAAFIAAPRSRSRALDLKGRAFLHEYDSRLDRDGKVLETILTAPVVVAHWINFQYWASTVDPAHFGSGDKTRHNVVGGNVGVVEGAGGDLRIGLAQQSVHDGTNFVHEPMRLAVYVEAAAPTIDAIIARHQTLQQLVDGEWLFLYRIDPDDAGVFLRRANGWEPLAPESASAGAGR